MNVTRGGVVSSTASALSIWSVSDEAFNLLLVATVVVNAVGVVCNALLGTGLLLLRGSGRLSRASVQMLLQQGVVDLLTCLTAIGCG